MPESAAQQFAKLQRLTPQEAVDYLLRRDRLTQTFSWQDLWHDEHAQQFTVSRLARLDLLKAIQDGITKSVQGDLSRRDWTRDIKGLLQKEGWWGEVDVLDPVSGEVVTTKFDSARLKLIFDTNTRMANSAGLWDRIWRSRATHPYVRYITRGDERVRESHRAWANLTLPVDHPFWEAHWPPNGWRCRCRVTSLTQAEYDKGYFEYRGAYEYNPDGTVKEIPAIEQVPFNKVAPPEEFITWTNKRTGEVSQVPVGVSPGFDYNPGLAKARNAMRQKIGLDKLDALPAPIRKAAMTPSVGAGVSESFAEAVAEAHAALPINARRALAANGYEVRAVSRLIHEHPELIQQRPAGYPGELDFRHVDGLTMHDKMKILIAEQAFDEATGEWLAGNAERAKALLRHEVGHALDRINELLLEIGMLQAWQREAQALSKALGIGAAEVDQEIRYFTGRGVDGQGFGAHEVIADLYAIRHGGGTASYVPVAEVFPDTMQILSKLLDEKGL